MLKIGEFSKLAKITVKVLRAYDEDGLLVPKSIDTKTGYRYYESEQLYDLQKILSLRQAGLSIAEVKRIISGDNALAILAQRQSELKKEIRCLHENYLRITKLINTFRENTFMTFHATIKEIPACTVFYGIKRLKQFSEIGDFIVQLGKECLQANPTLICAKPAYCFVSYLDEEFTTTDFTIMYAEAVEKAGNNTKNVQFKDLPAITAVSVFVKGDYEQNLPLGYTFAMQWIKDHGYEIAAKSPDSIRECYIDGCWNSKEPADYLTEIQVSINKVK